MRWDDKLSVAAKNVNGSEIRELLKLLAQPDVLSFAGGIPDSRLFPLEECGAVLSAIQENPEFYRQSMQYSASEGYGPLRSWIAEEFSTDHTRLAESNVVLTNGAQQSLSLLATALINPGDTIAVANPTYLGALQVFGTREASYHAVDTDEQGLQVESLERSFRQGAKLLYTMPDFQNPCGMSISANRRIKIVELAHRYDVPIIEDTAYRELYYDSPPLNSLFEVEGHRLGRDGWHEKGLVLQLGTLSKTLMPALRVGWTIAPSRLVNKLVQLKQAHDLHTSTFNQVVAYELAVSVLREHVFTLRKAYRDRRDAMVEALLRYLPNSCRFAPPQGGMFVWLTLSDRMDARVLLETAIHEEKLAFVPGGPFHVNGGGANTLRLSFCSYEPDVIRLGIERLARLIGKLERSTGEGRSSSQPAAALRA